MRVLFILGHYLIAMKTKLSEAYWQCQDKSGRLGGVAGSVVLYVTEYKELLRVRKERKKGKHVAIKVKFVFNTKEILELVEEAEAEASKGKSKKRRTTKATTLEIENEEEESIENNISESESDYIIVASRR
jgi:hypothetical protein